MIRSVSRAVEIELVNHAGSDPLMLLAQEVKKAVGDCGEYMDDSVGVRGLDRADAVRHLLRKTSGMPAPGHTLAAWSPGYRERHPGAVSRQLGRDVSSRRGLDGLRHANSDCNFAAGSQGFLGKL